MRQRDSRALAPIVHRWTKGEDLTALMVILQQMLERGSVEAFFLEGYDPERARYLRRARIVFNPCARCRSAPGLRSPQAASRRRVLLLAAIVRRRVQAAESVSPMDGQARRGRFRALEERAGVEADHSARHARHSRRTLPSPDALYEPGMENGRGYHGVAARVGSARPGEVRLFAVPSRHGRSMRVQPRAG